MTTRPAPTLRGWQFALAIDHGDVMEYVYKRDVTVETPQQPTVAKFGAGLCRIGYSPNKRIMTVRVDKGTGK